ncbi:MAG: hypothetical protein AB7V32_01015 [Candidatus Berkiella sp.]
MSKFAAWCSVLVIALSSFCLQARATYNDDGDSSDDFDLSFLNYITEWSDWGQNINNNHFNINSGISKLNINQVQQLCAINYTVPPYTTGITYAKPLIVKDVVYWVGLPGQVASGSHAQIGAHKLKRNYLGRFVGCEKLWQKEVNDVVDLGDLPNYTSRMTPAYYERANGKGTLLLLTPSHIFDFAFLPGGFDHVMSYRPTAYALDAATGNKLWQVPVSLSGAEDPSSVFMNTASSPRVYNGYAYFGLSSYNNLKSFIGFPFQKQTARGHLIRLDLKINGGTPSFPQDVKTLYSVPARPAGYPADKPWFAGGGVWASTPSIIPYGGKDNKGLVLFASGQLYDYPDFVGDCMSKEVTPVVINGQSFSKRGETGGGAELCYDKAVQKLVQMGVDVQNEPLANNSVIAINLKDFTHAWHVPTNGIDAWQAPCGIDPNNPLGPDCELPVVGPDWDIGGNSPVVVRYLLQTKVISHNKGGELFWINAYNGQVERREDICVASAVGGIHWGFAYDPIRKTLLIPCSGADTADAQDYNVTTADGKTYCRTGILNGIDVYTGKLKWQAIGARAVESVPGSDCPVGSDTQDARFKYGKPFDRVIKNEINPNIPVNVMPDSPSIPVNTAQGTARADGVPSTSRGIVYWPMANGAVYAINVNDGSYLSQFFCDQGGVYTASPSVADGYVAFGCGRQSVVGNDGGAFVGHSIMIYGKPRDF